MYTTTSRSLSIPGLRVALAGAVAALASALAAQSVAEIATSTVATTVIDLDAFAPGPTSVAMLNAAASPVPATLVGITRVGNPGRAARYDINATVNALGFVNDQIQILTPCDHHWFRAAPYRLDLGGPSTEFGFAAGNWEGAVDVDFYLGNSLQASLTSSPYSSNDRKVFQMSGGTFDRVTIAASPSPQPFVIGNFEIEQQNGCFAGFHSDVQAGVAPLTVTFQDLSFTTDPIGILSWAWDFDNDGTIDSTVQNPTFTYSTCGPHDVALTVHDAFNPPSTRLVPAFIAPDVTQAGFTHQLAGPLAVQFSDTSAGSPTVWAWDFEDDGTVDSTVPSPNWTYLSSNPVTVSLTTSRGCGPSSTVRRTIVPNQGLVTMFASDSASVVGGAVLFDLGVRTGLTIDRIDVNCASGQGVSGTLDVLITPVTQVGKETDPSVWTLVSSGNALTTAALDSPTTCVLSTPISLSPGTYGVMLRADTWSHAVTVGDGLNEVHRDANTAILVGAVQSVPFSLPLVSPRVPNCALHYSLGGTLGTWHAFGRGCPQAMPLTLGVVGEPLPGRTITFQTTNVAPGTLVANLRSLTRYEPGLALTAFGAPSCLQSVGSDVVLLGGSSAMTLPNNPALAGLPLYSQSAALDPGQVPFGVTTSNAVEVLVGGQGGHATLEARDLVRIEPLGAGKLIVPPSGVLALDVIETGFFDRPHTVTWSTTNPNVTISPPTMEFRFDSAKVHTLFLQFHGLVAPDNLDLRGDVVGPDVNDPVEEELEVVPAPSGVCEVKVTTNTGNTIDLDVAEHELTQRSGKMYTHVVNRTATKIEEVIVAARMREPYRKVYTCNGVCLNSSCQATTSGPPGRPKKVKINCACR